MGALRDRARGILGAPVVLDDSGHFPWIEEPDAFFVAVTDWLGRHTVPGSAGG